ncbi:hypothetical protein [Comamonas sp. 4034]|uniref:hypothetical protein n=1 Tax=Comamonas sp. 4034 TaxID=3156455 RepID=UPI003D1B2FBC
MNTHATKIIEALGGTAEVARMCEISMPSVSNWKQSGIPDARVKFLRLAARSKLKGLDLDAAISIAPIKKSRPSPGQKEVAHG